MHLRAAHWLVGQQVVKRLQDAQPHRRLTEVIPEGLLGDFAEWIEADPSRVKERSKAIFAQARDGRLSGYPRHRRDHQLAPSRPSQRSAHTRRTC